MSEPTHVPDPLEQLLAWRDEALRAGIVEPDAMVLATSTPAGVPSARVVLFRGVSDGGVRFFTNYTSRKGDEIEANPRGALVLFWPALQRQIRLEGSIAKLPPAESDDYFRSRPRGHQLGAWASPQSQTIATLDTVREQHAALTLQYAGRDVPRPPHWGGFRLAPTSIEFWRGGADRLHDRQLYRRTDRGWSVTRLAP